MLLNPPTSEHPHPIPQSNNNLLNALQCLYRPFYF